MILTKAATTETVTALDQKGNLFLGDLSGVTAISDRPEFVGASLSAFENGVAILTLTRGTDGAATIVISDGAISVSEVVESYTPVLTSLQIGEPT